MPVYFLRRDSRDGSGWEWRWREGQNILCQKNLFLIKEKNQHFEEIYKKSELLCLNYIILLCHSIWAEKVLFHYAVLDQFQSNQENLSLEATGNYVQIVCLMSYGCIVLETLK